MKVLDLRCGAGHAFEGWFASEEDYGSQRDRGLLDCPVCGNAEVARLPSAPRLNLSHARAPGATPPSPSPAAPPATSLTGQADAVKRLAQAMAELLNGAQDVGDRFAQEARRIHYGQSDVKVIRGQATPEERESLADEGIEVFTLPSGLPPKTPLQ